MQPKRVCNRLERLRCEPLDREQYRRWLATQPTRVPMAKAPVGFRYPESRRPHARVYTDEEKRDMLWLARHGWWPLDIAVAYDVPIYYHDTRYPGREATSGIYKRLETWAQRFGDDD